jgi:predicted RNA-binding protein with RPS1 domain
MNNIIQTEGFRKIKDAYDVQDFLVGNVTYIGKQYLIVKVYGYPCIMLKSEAELFPVRDYSVYLNKDIIVKVVSIEKNESLTGYNINVSHKIVAEETLETNNINSFNDAKRNRSYKGIVKDYKDFGVFVTLGHIDGLVHKSHLPKEFPDTPENFVTIGSVVDVKVIFKDFDKSQLSLSIPSIDPTTIEEKKAKTPFDLFKDSLIPGESVVQGKVVFLEKECVTLHVTHNNNKFTVYIKNEDLAWEKVQNASDMVFLGEELPIRFLRYKDGRLYFELKWQQQDIYPKELFTLDTDGLLSAMNISENKFVAKVKLAHRKNVETKEDEICGAFATNIVPIGENDKNSLLVDIYTGTNIIAFVPSKYAYGLEDGKYYQFRLAAAQQEKRLEEHRPFMFSAHLENAIPVPDPYKDIVEKSFKENKIPKSNRESANYLREIGADMYTDRDRMFYELLQNADDASSKRGVKVMVQIRENYLIFTHDGLSFSRQDFRSIVSTANSTKRLDRKKTGYKGIGFKSVFTDSEKVYIKTGGFFFVFDKSADIFNNFREFYKYVNPLYTDEQLKIFFEENIEYEKEFEKVDHLPWQLLPFWVEECPRQLQGTTFSRNCNVAIALYMGVTAEKYKDLIKGIIQKPRFMLFLRNTLRIQFEDKKWDILSIAKHVDIKTNIVKLKNSFANNDQEVSYIVRDGSEIPVINEAFEKCNIPMFKECKNASGREKWFMYQIIDALPVPITSIPERIIAADTTTISYAFMLDEKGRAICIPDKTPSLYAYLPMEDRRYLFPFFINADFELSSNRQEAKPISVWNEYIFYNIGKNIVSWVATIASSSHPGYLSLLPSSYFTEELEDGKIDRLASQFNRGYRESLSETAFLLNDKEKLVTQKEIVVDESGFASIIGIEDFCNLIDTEKRMLHKSVDASPLGNKTIFADVEHIQTSLFIEKVLATNKRTKLLRFWYRISPSVRTLTLAHIANMPGNKKNFDEYIEDIPAYTYLGHLISLNKLLKSDNIILRSDTIEGIEDILEKLDFIITDEIESEHPFHSKVKESMKGYSVHVYEIIKARTSKDDCLLSASEKYKLFSHFIAPKRNIAHDSLTSWGIFCNQLGNNKPLSYLTHINSSLYNNITRQFVIDDDEYNNGPRVIDRYLMKEKDQYQNIVLGNWEALVTEIGNDEEKACSLYKLVSMTYAVAEHEQVKGKMIFPVGEKKFVFTNGEMHLLSDVILNQNLSSNDRAKAVVELLTGKHVPSLDVTKYVESVPFECRNQLLENLVVLPDVVLSLEQIEVLLQYCQTNDETLFSRYIIEANDGSYSLKALAKNNVAAYTSNNVLKTFIQSKCDSICLIPDELSKYATLRGVFTDDNLLIRILEVIGDVKVHEEVLLPIYKDSISKVKSLYLSHLSSINLNEESCKDRNDLNIQTLLLANSIEKPGIELYDSLRNKVYITCGTVTTALSGIKLEHTVEVNSKVFPLSKLLPNEDNMAKLVDTLKERIEELVSTSFANSLFGTKVDTGRASSVFGILNKSDMILENSVQIAFVLEYAASKRLGVISRVYDSSSKPIAKALCGKWLLQYYSFINPSCILNEMYSDLGKLLSLPYTDNNKQCHIAKELSNFNFLKESLSEEESFDLLKIVYEKSASNLVISDEDVTYIRKSLGMTNKHYVVSEKYSLQSEKLPQVIEKWRIANDTDKRTAVLCNVFGLINEDSEVVRIRKYLAEGASFTPADKDNTISSLTRDWIVSKELLLTDNQYLLLQSVIKEDDYIVEKDANELSKFATPESLYMSFSDYHIYLYDREIPWLAKFKTNNYVFHKYEEGDIAISGLNIFINGEQKESILDLMRTLVNTEDFSTDDFFQFIEKYRLSTTFDGEIDDDPDEDVRNAVSDVAKQEAINWLQTRGYDVSHAQIEKSLLKGVKKDYVEYHIVVKSYRNRTKGLKINPNEWLYLLNANSRLMVYMGHMAFAVFDRKMLLGNHDFLRLRISTSNFEIEKGKLDEVISRLAKDIQYFERTHFVFEHIHDDILSNANSLDDYNFYNSNSDEQFTAADDSVIL